MQEDFQSDRAFHVLTRSAACPMSEGVIRRYDNMKSRVSFDPETFGSTSVGPSAGSVKEGGTGSMDELSFIPYRTGMRGIGVNTNTGTETYQNPFYHYQPFRGGIPIYNTPQNHSNQATFNNPVHWT